LRVTYGDVGVSVRFIQVAAINKKGNKPAERVGQDQGGHQKLRQGESFLLCFFYEKHMIIYPHNFLMISISCKDDQEINVFIFLAIH